MQSYLFHDFVLKPEELSLYHKKERLELGLKGYKLLVAMVQNQGKLMPKDDLIAAAWEGQIVTDGTLSKQIERVRQLLASTCPEMTFIETVRGVGYKFIPEVKTLKNRKKEFAKWQKAIASVSIIPIVILLYFYPFGNKESSSGKEQVLPLNIAVIPSAQGQDYMNIGGLNYLANLLGKNPRIYQTSPRNSWFKNKDIERLAIELEDQKQLDYVLFVNLKEEGANKLAFVELKNNNQYQQRKTLKALSLKELFAEINNWVLLQLKIENTKPNSNGATEDLSSDSFAVESYLRGKKAATARKYEEAIQYFKTAVTQDSQFTLARLELIHAQIKSNDYAAAEALINTIETTEQLNDELKLYLLTLKASLFVNTYRPTDIKPFIDETIDLAEKTQDPKKKILALFYQGEMYKETGQIELSIKNTLKQKEVLMANTKDQTDLMRVANNLAHAYYGINQFENAKQQIEPAIDWFEKTKHMVGMLNSYGLLASIYYEQGNYSKASLINNKALTLQSSVEDKHLILNALEINGYLQLALGLHDDCRKTIQEMESLSVKMGLKVPQFTANLLSLSLNIETNKLDLLKQESESLNLLTKPLKDDYLYFRQVALSAIINANLILENFDLAKVQLEELYELTKDDLSQSKTLYQINLFEWMHKTGQTQQAVKKLNELLSKLTNNKQNRLSLIVAYLLLEIDENQGFKNSQEILSQISYIKPFPYPYLKYKAKVAAHNNNYFEARTLMQQLKNTSNQWWRTEDQIILDSYFEKIQQIKSED